MKRNGSQRNGIEGEDFKDQNFGDSTLEFCAFKSLPRGLAMEQISCLNGRALRIAQEKINPDGHYTIQFKDLNCKGDDETHGLTEIQPCQTFVEIDGEYMRITDIHSIVIKRYRNPKLLPGAGKILVLWNQTPGAGRGVPRSDNKERTETKNTEK